MHWGQVCVTIAECDDEELKKRYGDYYRRLLACECISKLRRIRNYLTIKAQRIEKEKTK